MEKLNPLVDFAFKKLFGVEENKDILIDLINAVVSEQDHVIDVEIKNPYNIQSFRTDKLSILDIKALGTNNKWYNIEMQIMDQDYYDARSLYYWARVYTNQLVSGINYSNLQKTISINFLNFNCLSEIDYHNTYRLKNTKNNNDYGVDHLEIHFIELKKYHETLSTMLDRWSNFLIKAHEYSVNKLPEELRIPTIQKAIEALEHMHLSEEEREDYESRLKWMRDEEMALLKAETRGVEKGIQQGLQQGLQQGAKQERIKLIKNFYKRGLLVNEIADMLELSITEVEVITKTLENR